MDTALTLLAVALLLLPGWTLWLRLVGPRPSQELAITGLAFALALAMVALQVFAFFSLTPFVLAWLLAGLACACLLYRWRPRISFERTLLLLAAAAAALRFAPALLQEFPLGWDPYFHLLVVRLIEQSWSHVTMLSPFEEIPIRYPTGTHLLVALIAKCTGAPRYGVFQTVLVLFGSLTCLQVYAWVHAATDNRRWALYGMASYAFLAVLGSLDYYRWGGLPNLIGMYLLAGCLTLVAQRDAGERRWWLLPPMYLAIALANHHVLATAFAVMLALLVWFALQRERRADARRLFLGGCIAALVGVPYLLYHLLSSGQAIHDSGLLTYGEPPNSMVSIVLACGVVFFVAVVAGAAVHVRAPGSRPLRAELLLPAAVMLALFVVFEYAGRELMLALYRRPIAPFTPSRFLTDLVYPASAFAGLAFLEIERRARRSMLPAVVLLFLTNAAVFLSFFRPVIDPDRLSAYLWVEANTRADTLVIDGWVHAPVLTNRASLYTALPSSELNAKAANRRLLLRILNRQAPAESADVPVVMITNRQLPQLVAPPGTILVHYPLGDIVDLNSRFPAVVR